VKARLIFWGNLALGVAILTFMLRSYGGPALDVLRVAPSLPLLLGFLGVVTASITCLAYRWGFILRGLSRPPALATLTLQRSAAHSVGVLIPSGRVGGDPLRAWLATRARVPAGDAIASVAVDRTLEIGSSTPFSVLFAVLLLQQGIPEFKGALVTVLLGAAGLAIGVTLVVRRLRSGTGLISALVRRISADRVEFVQSRMQVIESTETATVRLIEQPKRMLVAFLIGLLANLLVVAEFACLLAAFGLPLDVPAVVAATFATGAAHMLPIPGGIGVLEGAQIWIFGVLGYPPEVGLAVGLAVRFRELMWMAPGLLYMLARSLAAFLGRRRVA
jgi:uncharacterized protein (TIRG00374 family)